MNEFIREMNRQNRISRQEIASSSQVFSAGWITRDSETWTYASATTFTITGDLTDTYQAGDFVKFVQSTATKYGCITDVSYSAPDTTITINGDAIANSAITENYYSKFLNPQGISLEYFDADQLGSGDATTNQVAIADGSGGIVWGSQLGYSFVPSHHTSTAWDGDAKSGASGTIDLSAVFGVPAGVKAVSANFAIQDETVGVVASLLKESTPLTNGITAITQVASRAVYNSGIVPCDDNGDIYFYQAGELDNVFITITGYWVGLVQGRVLTTPAGEYILTPDGQFILVP